MKTTGKTTLSDKLSSPSSGVPTDSLPISLEGEALAVTDDGIDEDAVEVTVTDVVGVLVPVTDGVLVAVDDSELDEEAVFDGVDVTEEVQVIEAVFVDDIDGD